jgi:orotidine-5'-phosphate decarboxylase
MTPQRIAERLFVALDFPEPHAALVLARQLQPLGVGLKLGLQLYYAAGPDFVRTLEAFTPQLFVDLKLHDIPNTVAGAVSSLVRQGASFFNIHTQGGAAMMRAAVEAASQTAQEMGLPKPTVIGVTLLTSLSQADLGNHLRVVETLSTVDYAVHLARQAQACGLDGVVCSAHEAKAIRQACGPQFKLITPGIRPFSAASGDQSRVMTPTEALRAGSDYLVIGRPITDAADPVEATQAILDELRDVLA